MDDECPCFVCVLQPTAEDKHTHVVKIINTKYTPMKKLFLLLFSLVALNANAQDILVRQGGGSENVKVLEVTDYEVKYTKNGSDSIFTELCSNIFYIRYQGNGSLQQFNYSSNSRNTNRSQASPKYWEIAEMKAEPQWHLYSAGQAMKKSASCLAWGLGASCVGGALCAIGATSDNTNAQTGLIVTGSIIASTIPLACLIASIHFHYKAGRELRLSAGKVVYQF